MDPVKIAGVAELVNTEQQEGGSVLLGLYQFLLHFIQGFSDPCLPNVRLTRKDSTWQWGKVEKSAFKAIRTRVISAPILVFRMRPDPSELNRQL